MNGDELRDSGVEKVKQASDPDWKVAYVMVAEALLMSFSAGRLFTGTEVNDYVRSIIGDPHTPHAWSAMFRNLMAPYLKGNLVIWDGFVKSSKASHHSHYIKQYRKV